MAGTTRTVGAMNFQVTADTSNLKKGMTLVGREVAGVNRVLRKAETAEERLTRQQALLNKAFKAGAINAVTLKRGLASLNQTARQSDRFGMGAYMDGLQGRAAGMATVGGAIGGVSMVMMQATRRIKDVNREIQIAEQAGLNLNQSRAFGMMAEAVGKDAESVVQSIQEMQMRVADAAEGNGEAVEAMERLGLSIADIKDLEPDDMFRSLADAIRRLPTRGERILTVGQLFGGEAEDMHRLFSDGGLYDKARKKVRDLGMEVSESQTRQLKESAAAIKDLERSWNSLLESGAIAAAPALGRAAGVAQQTMRPRDTLGGRSISDLTQSAILGLFRRVTPMGALVPGSNRNTGNRATEQGQIQQSIEAQTQQAEELRRIGSNVTPTVGL